MLITDRILRSDLVKPVEADLPKGMAERHVVLAVAKLLLQWACGWQIVNMTILQSGLCGFVAEVPVLEVTEPGVHAFVIDELQHLFGILALQKADAYPALHRNNLRSGLGAPRDPA